MQEQSVSGNPIATDAAAAAPDALASASDCAYTLAVTTDTLVQGVHFFAGAQALDLGHKCAAVNLSDLAAMGASPEWLRVCVRGTDINGAWLQEFDRGLRGLACQHGANVTLHLGNAKQLRITVAAGGQVPEPEALRRDGGRAGHLLGVTGTLGDAGGALALIYAGDLDPGNPDHQQLLDRLHRPTPRVATGQALRTRVAAAMDVSDGLSGDVEHLLHSGLGARIDAASLPISAALLRTFGQARATELALGAGDDYELLLCVPPEAASEAEHAAQACGTPLRWVGMLDDSGVVTIAGGPAQASGYRHF